MLVLGAVYDSSRVFVLFKICCLFMLSCVCWCCSCIVRFGLTILILACVIYHLLLFQLNCFVSLFRCCFCL